MGDVGVFSALAAGAGGPGSGGLRPYQAEVSRAIVGALRSGEGATITCMMARQMGKNELSARVEAYLLALYAGVGGQIVKAAPTFRPQLITSKQRLEYCLMTNPLTAGRWSGDQGYGIRLGLARCLFFSADPSAKVVGGTASLLLEVDEAQDVQPELYGRVFRPMAASTNAPTVLYGTAWTETSLLETQRQENKERDRGLGRGMGRGGQRRHYEYPWTVLAQTNPAYGRFVRGEIARLGADHPIIRTQYELCAVAGLGRFLSVEQRRMLQGGHCRQAGATEGEVYVAGIDVAGEDEQAADAVLRSLKPRKDSTVVTVGRVSWEREDGEPSVEIVEHVWWTGKAQPDQYTELHHLLREVWGVRRVAVDATGVGAGLAGWLVRALGEEVVEAVTFSAPVKSALAYTLLGQVNSGRMTMYRGDGSAEYQEFWREAGQCQYELRGAEQMRFYVPEEEGHDDFVVSLALCAHAATHAKPAAVGGVVRPRQLVW